MALLPTPSPPANTYWMAKKFDARHLSSNYFEFRFDPLLLTIDRAVLGPMSSGFIRPTPGDVFSMKANREDASSHLVRADRRS